MTIITKGMGAIIKHLGKKRKTLTISFPKSKPKIPPRKGEVVVTKKSKPSKTKLADTWQGRRIDAINRKLKPSRGRRSEDYAQEASDIYGSTALTKKGYKANQKKFYSLPAKERNKIWKIKSRRELKGKD
jgi:hypothetical protein